MPGLARLIGALVAFLVGDLLRVRRRHVVESMRRAGVVEPERRASAMYRSLASALVELLLARFLERRVRFEPRALALIEARGAVVATAHTGSFDLVACAAARRVPLTVVTKRLSIGFLDRVWQGWRARRGVRLAQAGYAAASARCALARGEAVAMLIDQAPERSRGTLVTPFLGAPARVDLAPALLAARAGVPLVVVFGRRTSEGEHVVELAGALVPPPRAGRAWAEQAMRQATDWLDAFVRAHPEQWLWMHRRWKDAPSAALSTMPEIRARSAVRT